MKKIIFTLLSIIVSFQMKAINVTIIESHSLIQGQINDSVWHQVATGMGYNAVIAPQNTLDTLSNLSTTDILILSSATIPFPSPNSLQTVEQFVLSGRPVYIQSEYLDTFQGNVTFKAIMQTIGKEFYWTSTVAGQLMPMNVLGTLSYTPNNVPTLPYFWYGCAGTGAVENFLEYGGNYFGFCTAATSLYASVITTSDQDWINNQSSLDLMENILNKLANSLLASVSDEPGKTDLVIFPNPSTDYINISTSKQSELEILNLQGQLISKIITSEKQTTIDISDFERGIYFIKITIDKATITRKIIKI